MHFPASTLANAAVLHARMPRLRARSGRRLLMRMSPDRQDTHERQSVCGARYVGIVARRFNPDRSATRFVRIAARAGRGRKILRGPSAAPGRARRSDPPNATTSGNTETERETLPEAAASVRRDSGLNARTVWAALSSRSPGTGGFACSTISQPSRLALPGALYGAAGPRRRIRRASGEDRSNCKRPSLGRPPNGFETRSRPFCTGRSSASERPAQPVIDTKCEIR